MIRTIRIATRQSKLALWQANWVAEQLVMLHPDLELDIQFIKITTKGDKLLDKSLSKIGGKGLFVKELETALLNNEADIAVHSLKDMPAIQPKGLELAVYCKREDPRDVLISKNYQNLADLPSKATIGTSSLRRAAQLKILRSDFNIVPLRGNIDTRLKKALSKDSQLDAIILASAGIHRLYNFTHEHHDPHYPDQGKNPIREYLPTINFLPAPGQGIVTIEARSDDTVIKELIKKLNCAETTYCAKAERAFNMTVGGSCELPIAALAKIDLVKSELTLSGQLASPDGSKQITASLDGSIHHAVDIGEQLADRILSSGGRSLISAIKADN